MFGPFTKFKSGFARTKNSLFGAVGGIFSGKQLDADSLEALEEALYGADFGVETTGEIMEEIQQAYRKDKELRGMDAGRNRFPRSEADTRRSRGKCGRGGRVAGRSSCFWG